MYEGEWFGPGRFSQIIENLVNRRDLEMIVHVPFANCIYIDRVLRLCQQQQQYYKNYLTSSSSLSDSTSSISSMGSMDSGDSDSSYYDEDDRWKPIWILIPTLLGSSDRINPVYLPHLKALLSYEHCTGIIAGKGKSSIYIIGYQGLYSRLCCLSLVENNVAYLDPHYLQDATPWTHNPSGSIFEVQNSTTTF